MQTLNCRVYFSVPRSHAWFQILNNRSGGKYSNQYCLTLFISGLHWDFAPAGIYSDAVVEAIEKNLK